MQVREEQHKRVLNHVIRGYNRMFATLKGEFDWINVRLLALAWQLEVFFLRFLAIGQRIFRDAICRDGWFHRFKTWVG
jgi:hypothetical protein